MDKSDQCKGVPEQDQSDAWIRPEVVSFAPMRAAEGISYRPGDGIFNLS